MTKAPTNPTLATEVSKYPHWLKARAYLKNFLGGGRRHFIKTRRYAYYRHSPSILVIVIRLAPHIYEVRAYPPDSFIVGSLEEAQVVQDFRAWIFVNDPRSRKRKLIISTLRVEIELYRLVAKAIRHEGTLAKANSYYRKLV
ncbi:hypothetical protein ES708_10261 [subsurface metagenome]